MGYQEPRSVQRVKPKAQLRAEVEARTGSMANMGQLGWTCIRWSTIGEPVEFQKVTGVGVTHLDWDVRIVRTTGKRWRMEIDTGYTLALPRGQYATAKRKLDTPLLPGPVAMALWFDVEKANGGVNFRQSENKARS